MVAPASSSPGNECVTTRSAIVATEVTEHVHLFDIEGYSLTKELLPNGKFMNSHPIRIGGHLWHLHYYPNGDTSSSANFISIFLRLDSKVANPVTARVTYNLLDQAGEPVPSHTKPASPRDYSDTLSFGYTRFIEREVLENSEHRIIKDDRFTIKCVFTMKKLHAEDRTVVSPLVDVPPSDLHRDLGNLLATKEGADVTFQVGGETLRAHRYILASRSPVFKAELFGSMREGDESSVVEICDMEMQVFRALLQFVYTDFLPGMTPEEEPVLCQHLFVAADRYNLDRLKLMCEDRLCRSIDVGSVANILALAEQHCCHGLRIACIKFLESPEAMNAVMATDDFERLCRSCPSVFKELFFKITNN